MTVDKLKMHSPDLTQRNIDVIAELLPTVVTEDLDPDGNPVRTVDFDALRQELSDHIVEGPQERYQLDWPGKRAAAFAANAPIAKTLRPVREESVHFDTTKNLFIEGDNLDALKLLQESYLGKVDLMYIDPPYNTGSDSFVYADNFAKDNASYLTLTNQTDGEGARLVSNPDSNGRFHSEWLSMMYSRLRLARNLLRETGIICISIGDDEIGNLRLLCDEVFGGQNLLAQLTVEMSTTQGMKVRAAQNGAMVKNSEFVLVYARSSAHSQVPKNPLYDPVPGWPGNFTTWLHEDLTFEPLANRLNRESVLVTEATRLLGKDSISISDLTAFYLVSTVFRDFVHDNLERIAASDKGSWPARLPEPNWEPGQAFEYSSEGRSYIVMKSSQGTIRQFLRLSDNFRTADDYAATYGRTVIRGDLWKGFYSDMAHVSLEGDTRFENGKKPRRLIQNLIRWANNAPDALVMDFFAGSGTTADAVMEMNSRDGGARRFILVQVAEVMNDNAEARKAGFETVDQVAKDRLRRVGAKYWELQPDGDFGFRALTIDTSNMAEAILPPDVTDQTSLMSLEDNVKSDRSAEDLMFQVMLDWGLELSMPIDVELIGGEQVLVVEGGLLIACFQSSVDSDVFRAIARQKPLRAVFRHSGFSTDDARINAEQIFREISPTTDVKVI